MLYSVRRALSIRLALHADYDAHRRSLNLTDRFAHGVGKFGEYIGAKMDAIEWALAEVKLPSPAKLGNTVSVAQDHCASCSR